MAVSTVTQRDIRREEKTLDTQSILRVLDSVSCPTYVSSWNSVHTTVHPLRGIVWIEPTEPSLSHSVGLQWS